MVYQETRCQVVTTRLRRQMKDTLAQLQVASWFMFEALSVVNLNFMENATK